MPFNLPLNLIFKSHDARWNETPNVINMQIRSTGIFVSSSVAFLRLQLHHVAVPTKNACLLKQQQPTISQGEEEEDWEEDMCVHSDGIYAIFMALWKKGRGGDCRFGIK